MIIHETNLIKFGYQWKPKKKKSSFYNFWLQTVIFWGQNLSSFQHAKLGILWIFGFLGANSTNWNANFLEKSTKFSITQN